MKAMHKKVGNKEIKHQFNRDRELEGNYWKYM